MARWLIGLMAGAVVLSTTPVFAAHGEDEKAPDFYVGVGVMFDLEEDDTDITLAFSGSGSGKIAPDFGRYDDKLLLGVRYMFLGTKSELDRAIYGGPTLFYYDGHIGGGAIVGKHLSKRVIVEASYRATADWEGEAGLELGYGLDWPW